MIPLAGLAGFARAAMVARAVTPMISRTALGRFGMSRVFPFLKDTLKKGGQLIKRGGKSIGKRLPTAAMLLSGFSNMFGGKDNQEGGEFLQPPQEGGIFSGSGVGGSEALGAALPTTRNANIPSLPSYKSGKEGETIIKLLSIAVKYLAGVDATLKNQLDVQRASFTQTNQMAREKSLEGDGAEIAKPTSPVVSMMKSTGSGILSFFSSMLMKTLLLTAPLIIKKISDMVDGFDFGFGDDEEKKDLAPQNGLTTVSPGPTTRPSTGVLSVRNNNPGNLRFANQRGAIGKDKNGFAIFPTPEAGMEAMRRQIAKDTQERGLTLENFIKKYAPPSENPTSEYVKNVSAKTGIAPNAKVPADKMSDVMRAMVLQEGGEQAIQYFYNNQAPTSGQMVAQQSSGSAAKISEAAVDRAARESGVATTPTTPAPVVVAQNAPPPSSTTVTSGGPGDPSSVSSDRTLMTWIQYFSPMPA